MRRSRSHWSGSVARDVLAVELGAAVARSPLAVDRRLADLVSAVQTARRIADPDVSPISTPSRSSCWRPNAASVSVTGARPAAMVPNATSRERLAAAASTLDPRSGALLMPTPMPGSLPAVGSPSCLAPRCRPAHPTRTVAAGVARDRRSWHERPRGDAGGVASRSDTARPERGRRRRWELVFAARTAASARVDAAMRADRPGVLWACRDRAARNGRDRDHRQPTPNRPGDHAVTGRLRGQHRFGSGSTDAIPIVRGRDGDRIESRDDDGHGDRASSDHVAAVMLTAWTMPERSTRDRRPLNSPDGSAT